MVNNFIFDAAQAEVAYRSEQLYATRRDLRLRRLRRLIARTETVAAAKAAQAAQAARAARPAAESPRSDIAERSQEKVSAR